MKYLVQLVALVLLSLPGGGCATNEPDLSLVHPMIRKAHGDKNLRCMLAPERIESLRVSKVYPEGGYTGKAGEDYRVERRGPELTPEQIDVLAHCVADMRGYSGLQLQDRRRFIPKPAGMGFYGSGCEWKPGLVLVCHRGGRTANVVICFNCNEWAFEAGGQRYTDDGFGNGSRTAGLKPALRWLAVSLFPDDDALRRIPLAPYFPSHDE